MVKFKLNGADPKQVFHLNKGFELERFCLGDKELPQYAFEYAKKHFGITEVKPKKKEVKNVE